jgi:hypothetical protein
MRDGTQGAGRGRLGGSGKVGRKARHPGRRESARERGQHLIRLQIPILLLREQLALDLLLAERVLLLLAVKLLLLKLISLVLLLPLHLPLKLALGYASERAEKGPCIEMDSHWRLLEFT